MAVLITKMNGEMEPFREDKLDRSLTRAGAAKDVREHIIGHIKEELREGMTTQEIYQHAFELLKSGARRPVAARYSIKRAVLDLGPSGFPFEQFVGEVLKAIGYTNIKIGAALRGKCAPHEVDVTATDTNGVHMAAEAKFHNSLGIKTDLKVALYVKARWDDLRAGGANIDEGWIITNTRFTRDAARYGACNNLHLLGWDYPKERGLEILIGETRVHP
ncbi:MAG: ATP cone domain-containing protein, partial [bacterium]|nr:ATP cone domain-containing protein [bacterium]